MVSNYNFNINRYNIANFLLNNLFEFYFYAFNLKSMLLLESGDIETIPDLRRSSSTKLSHWNLNRLASHGFVKMSLIKAIITTHNFDII